MNIPNKLTLFRMILIPFFVFFLLTDVCGKASSYIALAIFIIASLTDWFDGRIARKYGMVTDFGKLMDPLADKLLVSSALICYVELGKLPAWIVVIIISREFIISGFRLVAADNGVVIAASMYGKYKTVFQMTMIIMLMVDIDWPVYKVLTNIVIAIAVIMTIVSLIDYIVKNKGVMQKQK